MSLCPRQSLNAPSCDHQEWQPLTWDPQLSNPWQLSQTLPELECLSFASCSLLFSTALVLLLFLTFPMSPLLFIVSSHVYVLLAFGKSLTAACCESLALNMGFLAGQQLLQKLRASSTRAPCPWKSFILDTVSMAFTDREWNTRMFFFVFCLL